jgi:hypothetical protein
MSGTLRRLVAPVTLALAVAAVLPPLREVLEASMNRQMLVQFPWLIACGFILAGTIPRRWRERLDSGNAFGITGLLFVAIAMAVLMIPRVLDLALVETRIEAAKGLALLACGAALRLSWRRAGLLVQGFFLGNVLPMTAAIGQLYEDSPLRLCNAYLLDDQVRLGQSLVALAVAVAVVWMAHVFVVLYRREAAGALPDAPAP